MGVEGRDWSGRHLLNCEPENLRCLPHICNTGLWDAVQCSVGWVEASTWMLPPLGDVGAESWRKMKMVGVVVGEWRVHSRAEKQERKRKADTEVAGPAVKKPKSIHANTRGKDKWVI